VQFAAQILLVVWGFRWGCSCGQTQTGDFLNGIFAPDGVLGLGTGEISVPSTLRRELGLLDSFSICTNFSGTGRIAFGDKGPITQQTTPLVSNSR
jgi:hypothetical protein